MWWREWIEDERIIGESVTGMGVRGGNNGGESYGSYWNMREREQMKW